MIKTRPCPVVPVPSNWTKNSVLILRLASFSLSFRCDRRLSISSIKTTAGCLYPATANKVLTSFSPSPIHLLVREELEIEKKVAPDSCAIAFPINVFPVPGGPYNNKPLGALRRPVNKSGRFIGQQTTSNIVAFASGNPAISSKVIVSPDTIISFSIFLTSSLSKCCNSSGNSSSSSSSSLRSALLFIIRMLSFLLVTPLTPFLLLLLLVFVLLVFLLLMLPFPLLLFPCFETLPTTFLGG
mmetsp:Transcript_35589/g.38556  ORF Transcript_35589/g.38556 Transcript_35589/m.38556 type:complete len:241 (-) Transcript_35589:143-865(-)